MDPEEKRQPSTSDSDLDTTEEPEEDVESEELTDDDGEEGNGSNGRYSVEAIRDIKYNKDGTKEYFVKWVDYDAITWHNEKEFLENADEAVVEMARKYEQEHPKKTAKPKPRKKRQPRKVYADEKEPAMEDVSFDRELQDDDEFYGTTAGRLRGELRGLYDPSHKVSERERLLAKINPQGRVTRRGIQKFLEPDAPSPTPSHETPSPTPPEATTAKKRKPRVPKAEKPPKTKSVPKGRAAKEAKKEAVELDDLYSAEADGIDDRRIQQSEQASSDTVVNHPIKESKSVDVPEPATLKRKPSTLRECDEPKPGTPQKAAPLPAGLPNFPIRRDYHKKQSVETKPPLVEQASFHNIRKHIEKPDELAIGHFSMHLTEERRRSAFGHSNRLTGENWLHIMLDKNHKCEGSHEMDGIVRLLCATNHGLLNEQLKSTGNTPLHVAVEKNLACTVRTMLSYHPDLAKRNKKGETVLAIALGQNNASMTRYLLEAGADFVEFEKKVKRDTEAGGFLLNHINRFQRTLADARSKFLLQNGLEEVYLMTTTFQHLGHTGPVFKFSFPVTPFHLPDESYTYLLFIYVCSINGDVWTARCWNEFHLSKAPELNFERMQHAQNSEYPMVFFCPIRKGSNEIKIEGWADKWKDQCPVIVANVILVRAKPLETVVPEETDVPLEVAPLVGPFI